MTATIGAVLTFHRFLHIMRESADRYRTAERSGAGQRGPNHAATLSYPGI